MNDLPDDTPSDAERKMQFLYALRSKGVTDKLVLGAMEAIDRGPFIRGLFAERAYEDMPLPIACGQTVPQRKLQRDLSSLPVMVMVEIQI